MTPPYPEPAVEKRIRARFAARLRDRQADLLLGDAELQALVDGMRFLATSGRPRFQIVAYFLPSDAVMIEADRAVDDVLAEEDPQQ